MSNINRRLKALERRSRADSDLEHLTNEELQIRLLDVSRRILASRDDHMADLVAKARRIIREDRTGAALREVGRAGCPLDVAAEVA